MRLKEKRKEKGIKAEAMAKQIGVSEPTYSLFENYRAIPTPPMMTAITDALECDTDDIYARDEVAFRWRRKEKPLPAETYRVTADLPERYRVLKEAVKDIGYTGIREWLQEMAENAIKERSRYQHDRRGECPSNKCT